MKIEFSSLEENASSFILSGTDIPYANALRRAMVGEVMAFAIEDVKIYDNTSALFDEIFAHRLGLIPLKTPETGFVPRKECSCAGKGCPACSVTFTMSVEGPAVCYSKDLISQDPAVVPVADNIPIVKLEKGQKVVVEALACMDKSAEHSKWQAVTVCGYKNYPLITESDRCDGCGMCVDVCPKNILEVKDGKVSVKEDNDVNCSLCKLCEHACLNSGIGDEPGIHINMDTERFIFNVEGTGAMPVLTVIEKGLLYLKTESDELLDALSEIKG